jgi:hypothetical protein
MNVVQKRRSVYFYMSYILSFRAIRTFQFRVVSLIALLIATLYVINRHRWSNMLGALRTLGTVTYFGAVDRMALSAGMVLPARMR